ATIVQQLLELNTQLRALRNLVIDLRVENATFWSNYFDRNYRDQISRVEDALANAREAAKRSNVWNKTASTFGQADGEIKALVKDYAADNWVGAAKDIYALGRTLWSFVDRDDINDADLLARLRELMREKQDFEDMTHDMLVKMLK